MSLLVDLTAIKKQRPVIHNLTNLVVMQTTANVLLALGASPIMAHAPEELADIIYLAQSLVLNMGTLDQAWLAAAKVVQAQALQAEIPIVFDPVGAGASGFRTMAALDILTAGVDVLRGNAAEIMALAKIDITAKGVDSAYESQQALTAAKQLSVKYQCIVVVSGQTDWVVAKETLMRVDAGTPLFAAVTGMGCSATAVIAAFCAVNANYVLAAQHALQCFGQAGERAAMVAAGPGSFYSALLDALYQFNETLVCL